MSILVISLACSLSFSHPSSPPFRIKCFLIFVKTLNVHCFIMLTVFSTDWASVLYKNNPLGFLLCPWITQILSLPVQELNRLVIILHLMYSISLSLDYLHIVNIPEYHQLWNSACLWITQVFLQYPVFYGLPSNFLPSHWIIQTVTVPALPTDYPSTVLLYSLPHMN